MNDKNTGTDLALKSRNRRIRNHVLCWVLYILYDVFFVIICFHAATPTKDLIFFYTCNISLFYVNYFLLSKYLDRTPPRYILLVLCVLLELTVFLFIKGTWEFLAYTSGKFAHEPFKNLTIALTMDLYRNVNFLFISTVTWSITHYSRFQRKIAENSLKRALAEKAHTELQYTFSSAQNAFLKQQINPHLLFNSLNAIYSTVYQSSPEESKSLILLSEIVRYSYREPGPEGRVLLDEELTQLRNLIELNSRRFDHPILLDFKLQGNTSKYEIIPLVLITLTENIFKHGDLRFVHGKIDIHISETGQLTFITRNAPRSVNHVKAISAVGLSNTRLRLDYAYPGNYTLDLSATDDLFELKLIINLNT